MIPKWLDLLEDALPVYFLYCIFTKFYISSNSYLSDYSVEQLNRLQIGWLFLDNFLRTISLYYVQWFEKELFAIFAVLIDIINAYGYERKTYELYAFEHCGHQVFQEK